MPDTVFLQNLGVVLAAIALLLFAFDRIIWGDYRDDD